MTTEQSRLNGLILNIPTIRKIREFRETWKLSHAERKKIHIEKFVAECQRYKIVSTGDESTHLKNKLEKSNTGVIAQDSLASLGLEIIIWGLNPIVASGVLILTGGDWWLAGASTIVSQGIIRGPYLVYRAAEETKLYRESNENKHVFKNTLFHTLIMLGGFAPIIGVIAIPFLSMDRNKEYFDINMKLWKAKISKNKI